MTVPHADGMIGSTRNTSVNQVGNQMGHVSMYIKPPSAAPSAQPALVPVQRSDVNTVMFTNPNDNQQPIGQKNSR